MSSNPSRSVGERLFDVAWLLGWITLSSIWCLTVGERLGATFDEPIYLEEGLNRWRTGSTGELMKLGTMPLPVDVETYPLYLWEQARGRPIDLATETHLVLPWARAMNLVFWGMLLFYAWLMARRLAGPWAGRLAVALLACEPNFLAHASLATTDICVSACVLAFVYHFRVNRGEGWRWRVLWPAIWLAIATLAKTSGLVFGYLCAWAVDWEYRSARRRAILDEGRELTEEEARQLSWKATFKDIWHVLWISMILVFAYVGSDFEAEPTFVKWAHTLKPGTFSSVMVWLSENLCIFSNAGEGILKQFTHNVRGHGVYIIGETHRRALWYFFPVALSIKLALPILLLPAWLLGLRLSGAQLKRWFCNWALLSGIVLAVFMVLCRVQIGIRLVFPSVAIIIVGLSAAIVNALQSLPRGDWRVKFGTGALAAGVVWMLGNSLLYWPHGLCYVNAAWRPVAPDYRLVSGADLDWGQGLKELDQWRRSHPEREMVTWYYGKDPLEKQLPLQSLPLHAYPWEGGEDEFLKEMNGRALAVSTTLVYGPPFGKDVRRVRAWVRSRKLIGRTSTFLIYDTGAPAQTAQK